MFSRLKKLFKKRIAVHVFLRGGQTVVVKCEEYKFTREGTNYLSYEFTRPDRSVSFRISDIQGYQVVR